MLKKISLILLTLPILFAPAHAAETINGAGATFPYPVYSAWAFSYQKETIIRLNYQSIGSGGGARQISKRTVEFGASDAPIKVEELEEKNLLQFPAIIGGVVPVVNIKGIGSGELKLTPDILAKIFLGHIVEWNDPEITSLNEGVNLPNGKISVIHRSDGSGTTAIFNTYLAEISNEWKEKVGKGKSANWPLGLGLSIVKHIAQLYGENVTLGEDERGGNTFTAVLCERAPRQRNE